MRDTITYLFGSIEERHDEYDVISTGSPLGKAIEGATVGDKRSYEGPRGNELEVQIVSIKAI